MPNIQFKARQSQHTMPFFFLQGKEKGEDSGGPSQTKHVAETSDTSSFAVRVESVETSNPASSVPEENQTALENNLNEQMSEGDRKGPEVIM